MEQKHTSEDLQETAKTENTLPKIPLTDAIVLAVLTVFSYIFHYFFEFGYLSYFEAPSAFISFNFTEMIPAIFFLVVVYLFFVFILWPVLNHVIAVLPGFIETILLFFPWLIVFVLLDFSWDIILSIFFGLLLIFGINQMKNYRERKVARNVMNSEPNTSLLKQEKTIVLNPKSPFDS